MANFHIKLVYFFVSSIQFYKCTKYNEFHLDTTNFCYNELNINVS